MIKRRAFVALGASLLLPGNLAHAQAKRLKRIGFLAGSDASAAKPFEDAFRSGLRDLGYVEGRDIVIDRRYAGGSANRVAGLVDELLKAEPDVLVGIEAVAQVMRSRTQTIPIVLPASQDPVAAGLVKSLASPGTNVTGMANLAYEMSAKHVELVKELMPAASRIGLLNDGAFSGSARFASMAKAAADAKGMSLIVTSLSDGRGVAPAFEELAKNGAQAALVVGTTGTVNVMREIVAESMKWKIPAIDGRAQFAEAGALLTYGPSLTAGFREAALFVDRILKGARPETLPVEQPTKFQLTINARTAKAFGIKIPPALVIRADRIIQ
jgi:putative ABC transport system substrate-binding protein